MIMNGILNSCPMFRGSCTLKRNLDFLHEFNKEPGDKNQDDCKAYKRTLYMFSPFSPIQPEKDEKDCQVSETLIYLGRMLRHPFAVSQKDKSPGNRRFHAIYFGIHQVSHSYEKS